jgi:hypothetical protein
MVFTRQTWGSVCSPWICDQGQVTELFLLTARLSSTRSFATKEAECMYHLNRAPIRACREHTSLGAVVMEWSSGNDYKNSVKVTARRFSGDRVPMEESFYILSYPAGAGMMMRAVKNSKIYPAIDAPARPKSHLPSFNPRIPSAFRTQGTNERWQGLKGGES